MASLQGREIKGRLCKTSTPHFFKVILQDSIRDQKLGIPKMFVRRYGYVLSSPVILQVPGGATWKVELTKSGTEIWLKKGWEEFSKYYSLTTGNILVFRYQGNTKWLVFIFNTSDSEIDYDLRRDANVGASFYNSNIKVEAEVDILSENSTGGPSISRKKREVLKEASPGPQRKKKTSSACEFHWSTEPGRAQLVGEVTKKDCKNTVNPPNGRQVPGSRKQLRGQKISGTTFIRNPLGSGTPEALEANKEVNSSTIPSLEVIVRPYHLGRSAILRLPIKFLRANIKKDVNKVILEVGNRQWPVKLIYSCASLSAGWKLFAKENSLEAGDCCLFEVIKSNITLLKVSIRKHIA